VFQLFAVNAKRISWAVCIAFCSGVFALDFTHRFGWARPFVLWIFRADHMLFKVMRHGGIQVAANRIGNFGNVFAGGFVALLCPDGHLQDLALAVRVRTFL